MSFDTRKKNMNIDKKTDPTKVNQINTILPAVCSFPLLITDKHLNQLVH